MVILMGRKSQKHSGLNFFGIWWLYASYYFVFGTLSPNIDSIIASMPGATRPGISLLSALQLTINIISLLFFGTLSDKLTKKISRKSLLLIANGLILAGTICIALSPNFMAFFFFIQLVSLGSGSFLAVGFPIISDSFEQKDRGNFFGLMQFSLLLGAGGGMLLGAVIGGLGLNGWRYAYAMGAILMIASLTLYQIFGFDPRRGSSDPELINLGDQIDYVYKMSLDSIKNVVKSKTILLSFVTVVAINITHTTLGLWGIPFLNSKINPGSSSLVSTLIFVLSQLGGLVGSILGGKLGDSLYRKKKSRGRILLSTMSLILGSLSFIVFYLLIPFDNSTIFSIVLSTCLMMIFGFIGSIFIAMRVGLSLIHI